MFLFLILLDPPRAFIKHKTFFLSTILSINAFDQWGVEKGKLLAKTIETDLKRKRMSPHDPSTEKLLSLFLGIDNSATLPKFNRTSFKEFFLK